MRSCATLTESLEVCGHAAWHSLGDCVRCIESTDCCALCLLCVLQAPAEGIPFLSGAPEWVADVNRGKNPQDVENTKVRLLQIDISVKDKRADEAGAAYCGADMADNVLYVPGSLSDFLVGQACETASEDERWTGISMATCRQNAC